MSWLKKFTPNPSFLSQDKKSNFHLEQIKLILLNTKIKNFILHNARRLCEVDRQAVRLDWTFRIAVSQAMCRRHKPNEREPPRIRQNAEGILPNSLLCENISYKRPFIVLYAKCQRDFEIFVKNLILHDLFKKRNKLF